MELMLHSGYSAIAVSLAISEHEAFINALKGLRYGTPVP